VSDHATVYEGGPFDGYQVQVLRPVGRNVAVASMNELRRWETNERAGLRMVPCGFRLARHTASGAQRNFFTWTAVRTHTKH